MANGLKGCLGMLGVGVVEGSESRMGERRDGEVKKSYLGVRLGRRGRGRARKPEVYRVASSSFS